LLLIRHYFHYYCCWYWQYFHYYLPLMLSWYVDRVIVCWLSLSFILIVIAFHAYWHAMLYIDIDYISPPLILLPSALRHAFHFFIFSEAFCRRDEMPIFVIYQPDFYSLPVISICWYYWFYFTLQILHWYFIISLWFPDITAAPDISSLSDIIPSFHYSDWDYWSFLSPSSLTKMMLPFVFHWLMPLELSYHCLSLIAISSRDAIWLFHIFHCLLGHWLTCFIWLLFI